MERKDAKKKKGKAVGEGENGKGLDWEEINGLVSVSGGRRRRRERDDTAESHRSSFWRHNFVTKHPLWSVSL